MVLSLVADQVFELARSPEDDRAQALFAFGPAGGPSSGAECALHHSTYDAEDGEHFRAHAAGPIFPGFGAVPNAAHRVGVAGELVASGLGELVHFAAVFLFTRDEAFVFELLKGGVDAAGAGTIHAAGAVLQLLHELVAVLRPFLKK